MIIMNMDRSRCGIVIDLSDHLPTEQGRYTIVQHIEDCRAFYIIFDHKTNTVLHGDKWHDHYAFADTTGHTFRLSGKQIVRIVYDSALCVDTIEDLPGEVWKFIGLPFCKSRETSLISNYGRVKSYADGQAILRHWVWNKKTRYWEIKFGRTKKERPSIHRLMGYYWCWPRDCPELPFDPNIDIHHISSKDHNEAWNLIALPKPEHKKLHKALRAAHKEATTGGQQSA